MNTKPYILSYGGGKDSTAILAMALYRDRAAEIIGCTREQLDAALPPLEAVVFADTGAELAQTYLNVQVAEQLCEKAGIVFKTVFLEKEGQQYKIQDHHIRLGTLPIMPGGSHVCSKKFKQAAVTKWKQDTYPHCFVTIIGYEYGEVERCNKAAGAFSLATNEENCFPLIDLKVTREMCDELLEDLWPIEVVKSSCVFCPYMKLHEIENVYRTDAAAWQIVRDLEKALREQSDIKHGRFVEMDKAWRAGQGESPYKKLDGRDLSPAELDARKAAGEKVPAAKTGLWSKHTWDHGIRVFWGLKEQLTIAELEARFDAAA